MPSSPHRPSWSFRLTDERTVSARTPLVVDDRVYAVFTYQKGDFFETQLSGFDLVSGQRLWDLRIDHVASAPVADRHGNIFVSSFGGQVLAFDRSGAPLWRGLETGTNLWVPTLVAPDRLVVTEIGGGARHSWCLDAQTGRQLWRFETGGHTRAAVACDDLIVQATPAGDRGSPPDAHRLTAVRVDDGSLAWAARLPAYPGALARLDGQVVVGARGGLLVFDLTTGKRVAETGRPEAAGIGEPLALDRHQLASADGDATLRVFGLESRRGVFRSSTALVQRWQAGLSGPPVGRPERVFGKVAVLSADAVISLYDPETGQSGSRFKLPGEKHGESGGLAATERHLAATIGRTLAVFQAP